MAKATDYSDCGSPHETGSQIFYECPVNGAWKTAFDACMLYGFAFLLSFAGRLN